MSDDPQYPQGHQILRKVAANALDDPDYKRELLANPTEVLRREGIKIPDGVNVEIHENTKDTIHLALPTELPDFGELDMDLVDIVLLVATHF